jgi:hypothetical protein
MNRWCFADGCKPKITTSGLNFEGKNEAEDFSDGAGWRPGNVGDPQVARGTKGDQLEPVRLPSRSLY